MNARKEKSKLDCNQKTRLTVTIQVGLLIVARKAGLLAVTRKLGLLTVTRTVGFLLGPVK